MSAVMRGALVRGDVHTEKLQPNEFSHLETSQLPEKQGTREQPGKFVSRVELCD